MPPITVTAKFSVLGDSDDSKRTREPKTKRRAVFSTDILKQSAPLSLYECIPQALYSGTTIHKIVNPPQETDEALGLPATKILLEQWRAVDQGILSSLPIMASPLDAEEIVERVREQSVHETTVKLAQALYCGTFPVDEACEDSSVAPYLGDILSLGAGGGESFVEKAVQQEETVIEIPPIVVKETKNTIPVSPIAATETLKNLAERHSPKVTENLSDAPSEPVFESLKGEDKDTEFVESLSKKWKAVESGELQSLPMETLTPHQLKFFVDHFRGCDSFAPTTVSYIKALYGLPRSADEQAKTETKGNDQTAVELPNGPSTKQADSAHLDQEEVPLSKTASKVLPEESVRTVEPSPAELSSIKDESTVETIALSSLWAQVDAGNLRSLPLFDISRWPSSTLCAFLDGATSLSSPTVRLLDFIYGFSRHDDAIVRVGYHALVARSSTTDASFPLSVTDDLLATSTVDTSLDYSQNSDKENEDAVDNDIDEAVFDEKIWSPNKDVLDDADEELVANSSGVDDRENDGMKCTSSEDEVPVEMKSSLETTEQTVVDHVPMELRSDEVAATGYEESVFPTNTSEQSQPKQSESNVVQSFKSRTIADAFEEEKQEHPGASTRDPIAVELAIEEEIKSTDVARGTFDQDPAVVNELDTNVHEDQKKHAVQQNYAQDSSLVKACLDVTPLMGDRDVLSPSKQDGANGGDRSIDNPTVSVSVARRLSRSNTPILSNRSADKEPHAGDLVVSRFLLDKLEEEKQTQVDCGLPKEQPSPEPNRVSSPSYSEMAKKLASVSKPFAATNASASNRSIEFPNLLNGPTSKQKPGKRFVASLSAVVNEGDSPVAPAASMKTLESVDSNIIVLHSSQAIHPEVIRQQKVVEDTLSGQGISHVSIDGANRDNKKITSALFDLSGSFHGEFPQIFVQSCTGQKVFWGGYDRFVADDGLGVDLAALVGIQRKEQEAQPIPSQKRTVKFKDTKKGTKSKRADKMSSGGSNEESKQAGGRPPLPAAKMAAIKESAKSDITFYGSTSFVAKHALDYIMRTSLAISGTRKVTLAGRNAKKVAALKDRLKEKMANLCTVHAKASGKCVFDTFIADSSDKDELRKMCQKTKVVANFAGPFEKYAENVISSCAEVGTDYVDITGEVSWAGKMRAKYGDLSEKSGARIISLCGFDSIPSDLAIFGAVDALRKKSGGDNVELLKGTCWHHCFGMANGGTVQTAVDMPLDLGRCLLRWVPFLLDDPLVLAHPRVRVDPDKYVLKNKMAWAEWMNQLPSMDSIFGTGWSAPFFMAPVNSKVVHASAVSLEYGPSFTYRERYIPVSFGSTRGLGVLSLIPVLLIQSAILLVGGILKFPILGGIIARMISPAGTGCSDQSCQQGFSEVYSEVETAKSSNGKIDRANCAIRFDGDPGNWTTAQCICESALALVLDRSKLPPKSSDGFGTPAELLGNVLLKRLKQTNVRPVEVSTYVRKGIDPDVNFLCHFA